MLANTDIREAAKEKGVRLWEIAERLRISDPTMSRKLRRELSEREKKYFLDIIDDIAAEKENAARSATNTTNG